MITILLLLILGFILWPLIKGLCNIVRQVHRMRSFMNDPAEFMRREAERQQRSAGRRRSKSTDAEESPRHQRRGKKIGADVGEYVEYTEINGTWESTAGERVDYHESQVSDVEWEDIK